MMLAPGEGRAFPMGRIGAVFNPLSSRTKAKPEEGSACGVSTMLSVMKGAEWRMMRFDAAFDPKGTLAK